MPIIREVVRIVKQTDPSFAAEQTCAVLDWHPEVEAMKEEVERALANAGAPPGYTLVESDGGATVTVEYPDRQDVAVYTETLSVPDSRRSRPGVFIRRCSEIIEQAGYSTELVRGPQRHTLVVRRH